MLPPVGKPKTSLNIDSTWTQPQLQAAYNWLYVTNDRSLGIHNMAYTVGLLKTSISHLTASTGMTPAPDIQRRPVTKVAKPAMHVSQ